MDKSHWLVAHLYIYIYIEAANIHYNPKTKILQRFCMRRNFKSRCIKYLTNTEKNLNETNHWDLARHSKRMVI